MERKLKIGGVDMNDILKDILKDIELETTEDDELIDFTPPFTIRKVCDWKHIQKLSKVGLKEYLLNQRVLRKESVIYNTHLNTEKDFIILYGDAHDPYFIVASIISPDNAYNYVSIAAMESGNNSLYISDINVKEIETNKGYGSLLLNQLKANALQYNKNRITGTLTSADLTDHGNRLVHFYRKHDFEVELFGSIGKVVWNINSSTD
ncbi:GNAT family N-acetyltransferase [Brevibacillus laterosporus]|nr:GNAT family N-acetyltransferase [Brevibacillus laterosporus]TPG68658.1 GNAT family N-acetyltransferase [Brevibacillus laterosporus]